MTENIKNQETIEQIFEGYKELRNQETPLTESQEAYYEQFGQIIDQLRKNMISSATINELCFTRDMFARESEKQGFVIGFKMAINLICECAG